MDDARSDVEAVQHDVGGNHDGDEAKPKDSM